MKGGKELSPLAVSLSLAPFGLILIALGAYTGWTGRLEGRGGAVMTLDPTWTSIVASFFIVLGCFICASPLYYLRPRKPAEPGTASDSLDE